MGLPVCPLTWRRVRMGPRGAFPGDVPTPCPRRPHPVQRHVRSQPVPTSATARASGGTPRIPGRVAAGASARAFLPLIHRPSGHKSHLVPSLNKGCRRIPVHKSPNPCSFPSRQDSGSQRPLRARHSGPATRRVGLAASTPALFSAVTLITGTSLGGSRVPPAMSRSFFLCSSAGAVLRARPRRPPRRILRGRGRVTRVTGSSHGAWNTAVLSGALLIYVL